MSSENFERFASDLYSIDSADQLTAFGFDLCEAFGLGFYQYLCILPTSYAKPETLTLGNFPAAWSKIYQEKHYLASDPFIRYARVRIAPVFWDTLFAREKRDSVSKMFFDDLRLSGLVQGFTVPLRAPKCEAMFSVACGEDSDKTRQKLKAALPFISALAPLMHETIHRIHELEKKCHMDVQLTKRERECLIWAAEGKTTWETAKILDISERTVIYHLQNAANKFGVRTRPHAVARAIAQGLVQPVLDENDEISQESLPPAAE